MKQAVFVSRDRDQLTEVELMLARRKINVAWTGTGEDALSLLTNTSADLLVLAEDLPDTDAKALVEAVITRSPFTHCTVAGAMDHKAFHDHYEGYGVLMQLSPVPTREDALALEAHLDKLAGLGSAV